MTTNKDEETATDMLYHTDPHISLFTRNWQKIGVCPIETNCETLN